MSASADPMRVGATAATAILAEDEPLLAEHLRHSLAQAWPALTVLRTCGDGLSAVEAALSLRPDVVFLDIRMPGLDGLQAAEAIAEDWPDNGGDLPLLVFVTAYEQHAVEAFDRAAVDYLLKPLDAARLERTCDRLQLRLAGRRTAAAPSDDGWLDRLRTLLGTPAEPLRFIPVGGSGGAVVMVPIDEVLFFEAADKYVRVVTATGEHLIRLSLRQLQPQLDPQRFWPVHRGTIVRADAIARAWRDDAGKVSLELKGGGAKIAVSRVYAHRFRAW